MICAKFGGNWPSSSLEYNFKVSFMYFRILLLYHLEKHMKFYEFESLLQKNALCQFKLKMAQRYWRRKPKFKHCILFILLLFPLEKYVNLHSSNLDFPSPKAIITMFG